MNSSAPLRPGLIVLISLALFALLPIVLCSRSIDAVDLLSPIEIVERYNSWIHEYNKTYKSDKELNKRFLIFTHNLRLIDLFNSRIGSYRLKENQFADLTNTEYRSIYLGYNPSPVRRAARNITHSSYHGRHCRRYHHHGGSLPVSVDWRQEGAVTGVKDQGQCGNMSTIALDSSKWRRRTLATITLTVLTSSQAILIAWSRRAGKYDYSVTTANFLVEALKCALSLIALAKIWNNDGVTEDNRLSTTYDEVKVYPIPAALYLIKNLLQYYIFVYVDAPSYQILKNLNIISTGVLYRIILKKKLSEIQWAGFVLLCVGVTTAQLNPSSDRVLQAPMQGWIMAIVMALLSGFAGVYTEAIIKKRPSRNINVQNFWLYVFGMIFNVLALFIQDFDEVMNQGFFHGYSLIIVIMILNHALSGIAVSMVMKYADNIVKVYSTSVAMLLTGVASQFLFDFHLSLAFFLGSTIVSISVYLHAIGKIQR